MRFKSACFEMKINTKYLHEGIREANENEECQKTTKGVRK